MQFRIVSPFPEEYVPRMWTWLEEFRRQMLDDYCPQTLDDLKAKNRQDLANGAITYAVLDAKLKPIGAVWGEHLGDHQYMGHLVFDRESLTSSEKIEAARSAIARMFCDGARKICWQMFSDNRAFRIFLKRLGAEIEGNLRQATRRNGELVDVTLMASFPDTL
jgi:RimJ/RimL family protein N-acetyltransferase